MSQEFRVVIKSFNDAEYEKRFMADKSRRVAEQIERGVNINLNHDSFYTVIEVLEDGVVIETLRTNSKSKYEREIKMNEVTNETLKKGDFVVFTIGNDETAYKVISDEFQYEGKGRLCVLLGDYPGGEVATEYLRKVDFPITCSECNKTFDEGYVNTVDYEIDLCVKCEEKYRNEQLK